MNKSKIQNTIVPKTRTDYVLNFEPNCSGADFILFGISLASTLNSMIPDEKYFFFFLKYMEPHSNRLSLYTCDRYEFLDI